MTGAAERQGGRGHPLLILGTHRFAPEVLDLARDAGFEVDFVENLDRSRTDTEVAGLAGPLDRRRGAVRRDATSRSARSAPTAAAG